MRSGNRSGVALAMRQRLCECNYELSGLKEETSISCTCARPHCGRSKYGTVYVSDARPPLHGRQVPPWWTFPTVQPLP